MIDLADYTLTITRYIRARKLACVYVFAEAGERPCKIGYALNLRYRFAEIQKPNHKVISIEYVVWTPGVPTALLIEEKAKRILQHSHLRAGWYDTAPFMACAVIRAVINSDFKKAQIIEHQAFIGLLRQSSSVFADKAIGWAS